MEDPKQMNPLPNLEMLILYQYLYEYLFNFEQIDDYESANKLLYNFLTDSTLSQQEDTDEYVYLFVVMKIDSIETIGQALSVLQGFHSSLPSSSHLLYSQGIVYDS